MNPIEFIQREYGVLKTHPYHFAMTALIAGGIAFAGTDYHYAGRIDSLKETLETKEFPKPVFKTQYILVPDHSQAREFKSIGDKLDAMIGLLKVGPQRTSASPRSAPVSQHTETTSSQSGVAMGSGSHIETVNQNALPARSAFAAQLGNLYTEGYLLEQRLGVKGINEDQLASLDTQAGAWSNKVIAFMNSNMCSDAAAYFLKFHRGGMSYGLPEKQNNVFDIVAEDLDNLSDIKRNDAWDCK